MKSKSDRLTAAIRERSRLLQRAHSFTTRKMPIPASLRRDLDFLGLEIDRIREEANDERSAA